MCTHMYMCIPPQPAKLVSFRESVLLSIGFSFSPVLFLFVPPCLLLFFGLSLLVCSCPVLLLSACTSVLFSNSPSLVLLFSLSLLKSVSLCPFLRFSVFL